MIKNLLLLVLTVASITFVSCEDEDDDNPGGMSGTLVGTWTSGSATINSFTINGEDISSFFKQIFIDLQYTEAEADALVAAVEAELEGGFTEIFEGTIIFSEDGMYEASDESGSESGTWEVSSDGQMVTFDKGTSDELSLRIVSLTDSRFEGLIEEEDVDDFDLDGTDDTLALSASIVLNR